MYEIMYNTSNNKIALTRQL